MNPKGEGAPSARQSKLHSLKRKTKATGCALLDDMTVGKAEGHRTAPGREYPLETTESKALNKQESIKRGGCRRWNKTGLSKIKKKVRQREEKTRMAARKNT